MRLDFLSKGTFVGVLSFAGMLSVVMKQPALGAFLSDPHTAELVTGVVAGVGSIIAGAMQSWHRRVTVNVAAPAAPSNPAAPQ